MLFQDAELARLDLAAKNLDQVAELTDTSIAEGRNQNPSPTGPQPKSQPSTHCSRSGVRCAGWSLAGRPTGWRKSGRNPAALPLPNCSGGNLAAVAVSGVVDNDTPAVAALNAMLA